MNLDVGSFAEPELPLLTVAGYREAKIVVLHPPPLTRGAARVSKNTRTAPQTCLNEEGK